MLPEPSSLDIHSLLGSLNDAPLEVPLRYASSSDAEKPSFENRRISTITLAADVVMDVRNRATRRRQRRLWTLRFVTAWLHVLLWSFLGAFCSTMYLFVEGREDTTMLVAQFHTVGSVSCVFRFPTSVIARN